MTGSAMRILIVSNFYPPHFIGGYELGCRDVAQALEARDHQIAVLTSVHGVGKPSVDGNVFRWLYPADPVADQRVGCAAHRRALARLEVVNQLAFDRLWRRYAPDVVYFWNLAKLPISLAFRAEARGPVCYYVSDPWLARWSEEGWYEDAWYRVARARSARLRARIARGLIRSAFTMTRLTWPGDDLQLQHVQFCSAYLKHATLQAGRRVADGEVVHWGIDTDAFAPDLAIRDSDARRKRLLYVGQLAVHKGVHIAIEALHRLHVAGLRDVTLTVVGASHGPDYEARLREQVASCHLQDAVAFLGRQSRESLPAIYRTHGILIFPSCWDEPFAITPLEAMASGLAVVGTTAGGNREIFEDGVNALTFPVEDSDACACQVRRLIADADFARDLAARGRRTVLERFTLDGMVDRVEFRLRRALNAVTDDGPSRQEHLLP